MRIRENKKRERERGITHTERDLMTSVTVEYNVLTYSFFLPLVKCSNVHSHLGKKYNIRCEELLCVCMCEDDC